MKRVRIAVALSVGLLVSVLAVTLVLARSAQARQGVGSLTWLGHQASIGVFAPDAIACSVSITTTDSLNNSNNSGPGSAVPVANYSGLALVNPVLWPEVATPPVSRTVQDDWFVLGNATPNYIYSFEASPDLGGNYNLGMEIYTGTTVIPVGISPVPYASDANTGDGNSTKIVASFPGQGPYYIRVYQISSFCTGSTYTFKFTSTPPTLTPTGTPKPTKTITPTPGPFACVTGADSFEPNNDFDTATTIGIGLKYTGLNFVECSTSDSGWDNDYFKARVKPGMLVTCRTADLSAGTDTNLILYDVNRNGINGQDDLNRAAGDLSSSVTYYVTYEGWLYGLVGEGFHRPLSEQSKATYSYECTIANQSTPTPAPTPTDLPNVPTRTPVPPTPTETPIPSPTLSPTPPSIRVIPLPTATPVGLPLKAIPVSLQVYYDADSNNKPDPGEGIIGVSARVFDLSSGNLLAQGLTDQTGRVSITVNVPGAVKLVVPYFNYSAIILPNQGGAAVLRISARDLPQSIP